MNRELVLAPEDDIRVLLPRLYNDDTKKLYSAVLGKAYILYDGVRVDWVWASSVDRVMQRLDVEIISPAIVVRLRLPWTRSRKEWFATEEEILTGDYEILEVILYGVDTVEGDGRERIIPKLQWETNRERYRLTDKRYLVTWKTLADGRAYRFPQQ